ncbi:MAG TPA: DUF1036 domain-containing protein [Alphaproteobacteria bacterium]|nr:DUF1036 domain-containing protein [Alphaproteobacteria bacterium]
MLLPRSDAAPSATTAATAAQPPAEPQPIEAETEEGSLRVCNQTANPVSIALGYRAERGWQSEGWWVAGPNECKTVFSGNLAARRYYYVYAVDDVGGGSWDGSFFMCTRDESFTIFDEKDCLARGYERTGFFEIDTHYRSNWTLQLTEGRVQGSEDLDGTDADIPLEGDDAGMEDLPAEGAEGEP